MNLVFNRRLILRFWMTIENNLNELLKSQKLRYEIEKLSARNHHFKSVYIYNYYKDKDRETQELSIFLISLLIIVTHLSLFWII